MATVKFEERTTAQSPGIKVVWKDLKATDAGEPHTILPINGVASYRTFHVSGEFAGASVQILGSSIEGEFDLMNDGAGNDLIFDEPHIKNSPDLVESVYPKVLGGGRETKITVAMTGRKG